ncbi:class I SAM-dependent methyltransferase [[Mycobacterium] holstebronense]|uniref:Class I SAM-dependent methyltransferase n=1 Tax=[Mycobacterium] holstebronense TaxID=3064288 RepID=A0ABN9NPT9_9MYCO|nr:class I SAM-dependent methyltransferase [Mycolicibacter sp. MU0102]CAJ1510165.1 class I SAM-dependent methyltransferase [Mycolicibacter sp. MU0102]
MSDFLHANAKPKVSSLFRYIETLHGDRAWGAMLDSGTGVKSLEWIRTLSTDRWTAITAAPSMAEAARAALGDGIRPQDRLLVGNWIDDSLLAGETFDTVLVDYLVGAIEGFAPYWQDQAFERLRPLIADTGRLYVTGLEPYVQYRPETESGRIIWEIGRARDACLLLAGERPYREYPLDWMLRQLERAGFAIVESRRFPIRYGPGHVNRQLDMCRRRLQRFGSAALGSGMLQYVEELRLRALLILARDGGLRHGHDYVIAAEPSP